MLTLVTRHEVTVVYLICSIPIFHKRHTEKNRQEVDSKLYWNAWIILLYLDYDLAFEKCNPALSNSTHHSFLMDNEGKLLYVGDPTKSGSNEKNLLNVLNFYVQKSQTSTKENHD